MSKDDFSKYDSPEMVGKIVGTEKMLLRDHIDEQYHDKFDQLDRDVLVITYEFDDTKKDWFCTIPKMTGYNKSNLKAFRDRNPGLSVYREDWVGQDVKLTLDGKGYLTVAL